MSLDIDCVVIGAGVVGLAVARALQLQGREVILLDKERSFGTETSSRNSEVIHAGIYYPTGSLKARLCVRGKQLLYDYCEQNGIPHRRIGKLIVATDDEERSTLDAYQRSAQANGVFDLMPLSKAECAELEPAVQCVAGLWSPSTGIIDSHAYMQALLDDFEMAGGQFVRMTPVKGGRVLDGGGIELELGDAEATRLRARTVVNSAGLHAPAVAASIQGLPRESIPTAHFAIGHYYVLSGRSPFKHLVYPIASNGGLGVHVTIDMSGAARFGPDVRWRDQIDYSFDDSRRNEFVQAIRRYYPAITADQLQPGYTGIRPKISARNQPAGDFQIQGADVHGVHGLVHLFGIESPGLTSALAIAEWVSTS